VAAVLVDSNVLLDVIMHDDEWLDWSSSTLDRAADSARLVINPIIYAEISAGYNRIEELDDAVPPSYFERRALPWEAAFLTGKCFMRYKRAGGRRYRVYFPKLSIIAA
jgi:hypothetical protein